MYILHLADVEWSTLLMYTSQWNKYTPELIMEKWFY